MTEIRLVVKKILLEQVCAEVGRSALDAAAIEAMVAETCGRRPA
jgi:hypothetical protein